MKTTRYAIASLACGLMALAGTAQAQFASTGATNLKVSVAAEAALAITAADTSLITTAGTFGAPFTGTTAFTYKIREGVATTGNISLKVTTDFGAGGPIVATPVTAGDALTYSCSATPASGTACTGTPTASTTSGTPVVGFAAQARSQFAGDAGSVAWSLTNDPQYKVGDYTAIVTFTISIT
jgi:hypothetical protein